ncbi:MAG: hypothetical protein G01um1014106_684, partial [Parcubacteria group bacterium Gr01-1014_106]
IGSGTWSNPSNAASSNDARATASGAGGSQYLKATNFSFSIPSGATITGIVVQVERVRSVDITNMEDNSIRLVQDGTIAGNNKATSTVWPFDPESTAAYGSSSDLWGLSWTASQINSADFGVVISVKRTDGCESPCTEGGAGIDHVTITVSYTPAVSGGGSEILSSSDALLDSVAGVKLRAEEGSAFGVSGIKLRAQGKTAPLSVRVRKDGRRIFTLLANTLYTFSTLPPEYERVVRVTLRTQKRVYTLRTPNGQHIYAVPLRFSKAGIFPYALTVDYGITTRTEYGMFIVKPVR